jgi:heme exporter protein C
MKTMKWWKILAIVLLSYTIYFGLMGPVARQAVLNESIRNLYFHVPMWFAMILTLSVSVWHSIKYLKDSNIQNDIVAIEFVNVSVILGILGCITGALWAKVTWGDWWPNDPKLNCVAIGMLIYFAYIILRGSLDDEQRRGRISAVYNIFAFVVFIVLIFVVPRLTDSLHPGNGGNPAFGKYDLDNQMRTVFYPAIIGWMLLAVWIGTLKVRIRNIESVVDSQL